MPKSKETREKILHMATDIMLTSHVSQLSIDNICKRVQITKKTFYYHFESKDQMLEAVAEGLKAHYEAAIESLAAEAGAGATVHARVQALLRGVARESTRRDWNGCYFLQLATELAHLPGHPARKVAAESNSQVQRRLATELDREGHGLPFETAGQLLILLNGLVTTLAVHRDQKFLDNALAMASLLVPLRPARAA